MPHSSDDPSTPLAPSGEDGPPSEIRPDAPAQGASERVPEGSDPPAASQHEGAPRRPRRRRRRRPPAASTAEPGVGEPQLAAAVSRAEAAPSDVAQGAPPGENGAPKPPQRRRRRRRPPREAAPQPAASGDAKTGVPTIGTAPSAPASDAAQSEAPPPLDQVARGYPRRRRRRRPARPVGAADANSGSEMPRNSEAAADRAVRDRPRVGGPRTRSPRETGPRQPQPQETGPRERRARSSAARDTGADDRGRNPRGRGPGGRNARDRHRGRGRDAPQKRPEQKLYALESVVDRGFEDIADESDQSGTHRVHWTIVKRTVADQKSGKPMSAVYVLQREGVEAEFPNLGAARLAVNKTIVHPEKLTLSKAEHAAAKK